MNFDYLGSDGIPIKETYNLYLKKSNEFKKKAKKYKQDNSYLKISRLHYNHKGYEASEETEREILEERTQHYESYNQLFNSTVLDDYQNPTNEISSGRGKRIRIIREIDEPNNQEFSEDFYKNKTRWFSRYSTLSKFIQAARLVIILNRLKKCLTVFKGLKGRKSVVVEEEEVVEEKESVNGYSEPKSKAYPCNVSCKC